MNVKSEEFHHEDLARTIFRVANTIIVEARLHFKKVLSMLVIIDLSEQYITCLIIVADDTHQRK